MLVVNNLEFTLGIGEFGAELVFSDGCSFNNREMVSNVDEADLKFSGRRSKLIAWNMFFSEWLPALWQGMEQFITLYILYIEANLILKLMI